MRFAKALLSVLFAGPAAPADDTGDASGPRVYGYLETAEIGTSRLRLPAKLDTGATSTSVDADEVSIYEKSPGDTWVRFSVTGEDGRTINYDQNVVAYVEIKEKGGGTQRRPVIELPVCVGDQLVLTEVNLADRDNFDYPLLIGRGFLSSRVYVDAGGTFTAKPDCSDSPLQVAEEVDEEAE